MMGKRKGGGLQCDLGGCGEAGCVRAHALAICEFRPSVRSRVCVCVCAAVRSGLRALDSCLCAYVRG